MQTVKTKKEIDLISENLISELRNVDGTTKKVTFASDYNVSMLDATELMIGQEPVKKFWSIKVFFGKTGKRPFYYHFDKDEFAELAEYVFSFKIKSNSLLAKSEKASTVSCPKCYDVGCDRCC